MITVKLTRVPGNAREFGLENDADISDLMNEADIELDNDEIFLVNNIERDDDWKLQANDEVMITRRNKFESVSMTSMSALLHELNTKYRKYTVAGFTYDSVFGYTALLEYEQEFESE